jgi:hypothetical protein
MTQGYNSLNVIPLAPITAKNFVDYRCSIFDIPYIRDNQTEIISHCEHAFHRIKECISAWKDIPYDSITGRDVTMYYGLYSIYSIAAPSEHFYNIYLALTECVNLYFETYSITKPKQVWIQSWLNNHKNSEVLEKHKHGFDLHGYISIDPRDTETVFFDGEDHNKELYKVTNNPGKLYLGPGDRPHYVNNLTNWSGQRFTLGFDVIQSPTTLYNLGAIPIVLDWPRKLS